MAWSESSTVFIRDSAFLSPLFTLFRTLHTFRLLNFSNMIQGKITLPSNPGTDFDWSKLAVRGLFWMTYRVQRWPHLVQMEHHGLCLVDRLQLQLVCVAVSFLQKINKTPHGYKYQKTSHCYHKEISIIIKWILRKTEWRHGKNWVHSNIIKTYPLLNFQL